MWPGSLSRVSEIENRSTLSLFDRFSLRKGPRIALKPGISLMSLFRVPKFYQSTLTLKFINEEKLQDAKILATPTDKDLDELFGKIRDPARSIESDTPANLFSLFGIDAASWKTSSAPPVREDANGIAAGSEISNLSGTTKQSSHISESQTELYLPLVRGGGISLRRYLDEISGIGSEIDSPTDNQQQEIIPTESSQVPSSVDEELI